MESCGAIRQTVRIRLELPWLDKWAVLPETESRVPESDPGLDFENARHIIVDAVDRDSTIGNEFDDAVAELQVGRDH
jgi:hypothetical protein